MTPVGEDPPSGSTTSACPSRRCSSSGGRNPCAPPRSRAGWNGPFAPGPMCNSIAHFARGCSLATTASNGEAHVVGGARGDADVAGVAGVFADALPATGAEAEVWGGITSADDARPAEAAADDSSGAGEPLRVPARRACRPLTPPTPREAMSSGCHDRWVSGAEPALTMKVGCRGKQRRGRTA